MKDIITRHKSGEHIGICSVCSAHPLVIEAALRFDLSTNNKVLIEATSNQVNQFGGYTGMQPADFRDFVYNIARTVGFPAERIILGGDHLGPNCWQDEPAAVAMEKSIDLIKACTQPVLGICLGMQLLGKRSEENNGVDLLGIIEEEVPKMTDHGLPLPHMGWNRVYAKAGDRLFRGIEEGAYFYFVHSYAMPVNPYTIAQCNYGEAFTAAVQKDNFFGVQFHPERSGSAGAQLLKNFLEM
jgi:imidazole glycerol phosphate synthase glutamine amidotransferase subunit